MDKRNPDQTRQRILAAAFTEIHRHGFQAASVANILADTGLTKGALYHHFPDKKALGIAVLNEVMSPMLESLFAEPVRLSTRPLAALRAALEERQYAATDETLALGCPINNLMQEMSPIDEDFRTTLKEIIIDWQGTLTEAFLRSQSIGEIHAKADPKAAALFVVSGIWGCIGVAKSLQSASVYRTCIGQLIAFLDSLSTQTKE